jgi:hypothetical protein
MENYKAVTEKPHRGRWFFLCAFVFACILFWWLPSILFRLVIHQADSVDDGTVAISALALILFIAGYLLPTFRRPARRFSESTLDVCGDFAYRVTALLFFPALLISAQMWHSFLNVGYELGGHIPGPYQALLYIHLFFGFMFLGAVDPDKQGWRRIAMATLLVAFPRLIISLHGGRFFLAQAVVPAILIAIARGWIRVSAKRVMQFSALTLFIIFVPAMTRDAGLSTFSGQGDLVRFFAAGSSLHLFQDNTDLDLNGRCPPLLVSMTAKGIPYGMLGKCVIDIGGLNSMPATLSRILTINDPASFNGTVSGTGSNYLLDLYLFGGMTAVYAGSALFGFSCRRFVGWIGGRSLFSGIWAECLTRSLFAPRSDLGYVYERIPSLILSTFAVMFIVWAGRLLMREHGCQPEGRMPA